MARSTPAAGERVGPLKGGAAYSVGWAVNRVRAAGVLGVAQLSGVG